MGKKSSIVLTLSVLLAAVSIVLAIVSFSHRGGIRYAYEGASGGLPQVQLAESSYPDFTFAAENAVKAVVHVKMVKKGQSQESGGYSLFDFFFGYGNPQPPRDQVGSGSGVILSEDGYIVTNNHVVAGADEISVTLENNRSFTAKVVGADPVTDIAVLKIEAQGLPFLHFGDSEALRLGQWVLAIGNPYNLTSTITAGIVSAKGRSMPSYEESDFKIESFIQTDAAVNAGNSGGALITVTGELIGINTAIASRTGSFAGYSFAVPSSIAQKVVDDLKEFGAVQRALLGVTMQALTDELAKEQGIKELKGVYIYEVSQGGAADKAGVKPSDVLLRINNVPVNSAPGVQEQVNKYRPNDKVNLLLLRNGKELEVSAVLQNRAGGLGLVKADSDGLSALLGAQLEPVSESKRQELRIRSGLEVVSLQEGRLKKAGVSQGFVITHVNQLAVRTVKELETVVNRGFQSGRGILIEGKYPDGSGAYYAVGR